MNRLWVRLSLAFSAVVFVSFIAVSGISLFIIRANIDENNFDTDQFRQQLETALVEHYQTNNSWQGIDLFLKGFETATAPLSRFRDGIISFSLADTTGEMIYNSTTTTDAILVNTVPITLNDQESAILTIKVTRPASDEYLNRPVIPPFVQPEELILLLTFVGGMIGILFGILMSRTLTASLDELAQATAEISADKLNRRVPVKGTEEIILLTKSFNDMLARLERAETLRRNIVGDVAHELRTPITALQANIYAILDDAYPMTKTEIAGLYEQTRLLSRLVNDLHELSQAEARQLFMNRRLVALSEVMEEFVAPFRPMAENKQISLEMAIPDYLPEVCIDQDRIHQVIYNLLSNAIRHTPAGGTVRIQATHCNGQLELAIQDTGEGIPAEHLPNVFERFYRADYARSRDMGGTGLGLAIVRAIVEAHEGQITAESTGIIGKGATFTIYLPIANQA